MIGSHNEGLKLLKEMDTDFFHSSKLQILTNCIRYDEVILRFYSFGEKAVFKEM